MRVKFIAGKWNGNLSGKHGIYKGESIDISPVIRLLYCTMDRGVRHYSITLEWLKLFIGVSFRLEPKS